MSIPSTSTISSMPSWPPVISLSHLQTASQNSTGPERSSKNTTASPPASLTPSAIARARSTQAYLSPGESLAASLVTMAVLLSRPAALTASLTLARSLVSHAYTNLKPPSTSLLAWASKTSSASVVFLEPDFPISSIDWPTPTGTMASTALTPVRKFSEIGCLSSTPG